MPWCPPRISISAVLVAELFAGCSRPRDAGVPRAGSPSARSPQIITAEDIERSPGLSLEQLLVTRVPGITLTRAADGRTELRIRGTTTVLGQKEPLVVLDGIALEPNPSGNLGAISPHDIATIEVLRDPAATAMYGARGSSGVIVIKSKRPGLPPDR